MIVSTNDWSIDDGKTYGDSGGSGSRNHSDRSTSSLNWGISECVASS